VKKNVASLLVRGSGKAADLISDAVILQKINEEPRSMEQQSMWRLLVALDITTQNTKEADIKKDSKYDYAQIIDRLEDWRNHPQKAQKPGDRWGRGEQNDMVVRIMQYTYNFGTDLSREKCYVQFKNALEAANSGTCWVYDLLSVDPEDDDFTGALLKCLLNGMPTSENPKTLIVQLEEELRHLEVECKNSPAHQELEIRRIQTQKTLDELRSNETQLMRDHRKRLKEWSWKKLKYIMLWSRGELTAIADAGRVEMVFILM